MLKLMKQPIQLLNFSQVLSNRNRRLLNTFRPYVLFMNLPLEVKSYGCLQRGNFLFSFIRHDIIISRVKSKMRRKDASRKFEEEEESDDEDDDEDEFVENDALVKTYRLNSLRIDLILKQVLNQKRKKIEEYFYNNKIRVNGKVLFKKAENAQLGDEIDLIKGISKKNTEMIEVSRVEILDAKVDDEDSGRVLVKVKKHKSLAIENYPQGDSWKEPEAEVGA